MIRILCSKRENSSTGFMKEDYYAFEVNKFHSGESIIPVANYNDFNKIEVQCFYDSDADLVGCYLILFQFAKLSIFDKVHVFIPYLPYSRMDRHTGKEYEQLSMILGLFAGAEERVYTVSLHNPMTADRINNMVFEHDYMFGEYDGYIFPDKTAYFRAPEYIKHSNPIIFLEKVRTSDMINSQIVYDSFKAEEDTNLRLLIIDDLCSRGGTFVNACKLVREKYPDAQIDLSVAHTENGVFTGELFDHIGVLYTTDSILTETKKEVADKIILIEKYRETNKLYTF